jgi:hypothetical protein
MAMTEARSNIRRVLIACAAALVLSLVLLEHPGGSRGANTSSPPVASSNVAVIPGIAPKAYPGTYGVPALPVNSPALAPYSFTSLPADQVTSAALSSYDTVLLYGIRWSDIPSAGQTAINAFAATHKVVIWDADDTGAQTYSGFVHPFSTLSSGEGAPGGASVVSYPAIANALASDQSSSPYYLDPNALVNNQHMINHMNAMITGTSEWLPALGAANHALPDGGWAIAWSYGAISDGTGLVVYSGLDADALVDSVSPNYALKEMALDLAAPFQQTPAACSPNCTLPPTDGGGGQTYAACSFAKRVPTHWVHGRVPIVIKTSVAAGITGQIVTHSGRVVARGKEWNGALVRMVVPTTKLRSNRRARLRAVILVKGHPACSKRFGLKVDNVPPQLLSLSTTVSGGAHLLALSVSEQSSVSIASRGGYVTLYPQAGYTVHGHSVQIPGHRLIQIRVSASAKIARLFVRDRAGNTVVRTLMW